MHHQMHLQAQRPLVKTQTPRTEEAWFLITEQKRHPTVKTASAFWFGAFRADVCGGFRDGVTTRQYPRIRKRLRKTPADALDDG